MIKYYGQAQLGEERFISAYVSRSQSSLSDVTVGTQTGQEPDREGHGVVGAAYWLFSWLALPTILRNPGPPALGSTTHRELCPPNQSSDKKPPYRLAHRPILLDQYYSQMNLACVRLTTNNQTNKTKHKAKTTKN